MKLIFTTIILSLLSSNLLANGPEPIGLDLMKKTLIELESPTDAIGKSFNLSSPAGMENQILTLLPVNAVETKLISKGRFLVTIQNHEPFYDMDEWRDFHFKKLLPIAWKWSMEGESDRDPGTHQTQSCVTKLQFYVDGQEITNEMLSKFTAAKRRFTFIYDTSILKQSPDNLMEFTRITNDEASVTLNLYNRDNATIYASVKSKSLAKCQLGAKPPVVVVEPPVDNPPRPPQAAYWSEWSQYNSCTATCGGGKQSRERTCYTFASGQYCSGNSYEERECNTQKCPIIPMTESQKENLKKKGVSINIINATKLTFFKRRGTANYEAALSNLFTRTIRCDISINSSTGWNDDWHGVDTKTHFGIVVAPLGIVKVTGQINIERSENDNGLNWADANWGKPGYFPTNCVFLD